MQGSHTRSLGRTGIPVTVMSFGAAPIGNFNRSFTDAEARGMVDQAWDLGVRYFDTAPGYGRGLSEYRLGHALHERRVDDYVVSTKVGRVLRPASFTPASDPWVQGPPFEAYFDYTYDGVMRSFEDSLQRLLTDHVDIVLMHDIDRFTHGSHQKEMFETAIGSGFKALEELRAQGAVAAIGVGVNEADVCAEAVRRTDADCVLLAGRYTLLEQEPLDDLLPLCSERGIGVVLGGVYNSGVLATGPIEGARFNYGPAPAKVVERAARLQAHCARHDVALAAAALQFAAAHSAVSTICTGSRDQKQQAQAAAWFEESIPPQLWDDLRADDLIREDAPTPS